MGVSHPIIRSALAFVAVVVLSFPVQDRSQTGALSQASQKPSTTRQDSEVKDKATVKLDLKSPYTILQYINEDDNADLRKLWRSLGLDITYNDLSYKCDGACKADAFVIDVNRKKHTVIKISFEQGNYYQFLIFRKLLPAPSKEEWKLIGAVDSSYQQYGAPKHRVESSGTQTWFVIDELWGRGSGVSLYGEKWHEVSATGVREVLSFPVSGHQSDFGTGAGRAFHAGVIGYDSVNGASSIKVKLSVKYFFGLHTEEDLFLKDQLATFLWDERQKKFVLNESNSDLTGQEIETVYNIDSLSYEEFVEYNLKELVEVAEHGSGKQKEWLRQFLPQLNASPQKSKLEQALKP